MPHADSVMNDEHGSQSDISDKSSSNPITRVIKVMLPTPTISLYKHSFIHACIYSIHPKHCICSQMHHNAPCCVAKRL